MTSPRRAATTVAALAACVSPFLLAPTASAAVSPGPHRASPTSFRASGHAGPNRFTVRRERVLPGTPASSAASTPTTAGATPATAPAPAPATTPGAAPTPVTLPLTVPPATTAPPVALTIPVTPATTLVSTPGSSIARAEIIARALAWVQQSVPYSQSTFVPDVTGLTTYRTDCSGFVTMAWHTKGSYWTGTMPSITTPITYDDLLPGDALLSPTHTALFIGWSDPARTKMIVWEENPGGAREKAWSQTRYLQFRPVRYTGVAG